MNKQTTITVTVVKHENVQYANLGTGDLAEAVAAGLKAEFAGHYVKSANGEFLYYNGFCDGGYPTTQAAYQDMVNRILK